MTNFSLFINITIRKMRYYIDRINMSVFQMKKGVVLLRENCSKYRLGEILFHGSKKVLILDIKPLMFYAKIRYLDSNKEACVNIKGLSTQRKNERTLSLGIFSGGGK